ncbi:MAG: Nif3-like dinuclear metal center hexameric protein [Erysipelotrichia bacterium]|nr:Nif3-like dinuclear metal center hexameric protein [Erysipelotrichia bacterium]
MNTKKLLLKLGKRFPKRYADMYQDRVGLMVGNLPKKVHKIILCLDFDWEVYSLAKEMQPDIIITHHPFIYGPKGKVFKTNPSKEALYHACEEKGLVVYSYHTNFDAGEGGMNDALAEALSLDNVYTPKAEPLMRIGEVRDALPVKEFAVMAKQRLKTNYGLLLPYGNKSIKKVAIIGGGGSRYWPVAKAEGCDIYISGDVPHHVRRDIVNAGFNYLDLPHEIERIFMPQMRKILLEIDPTLDIKIIDHERLPEVI